MKQSYYIGIDISKAKLDIAIMTSTYENVRYEVVNNSEQSLKTFFTRLLRQLRITASEMLVCCEQAGIYGRPLEKICVAMDIPLWVELAIKIRRASTDLRGKSDKKDALRIAEYAARYIDKVRFYQEAPEACSKLQTLLNSRNTLLLQLNQLEQQLSEAKTFDPEKYKLLKSCYDKPLKVLEKQISQIEADITKIKETAPDIKAKAELIKSIPGIGEQTALHFIVYTRNFTTFESANHLACYAGVAPFPNESGISVKRARTSSLANQKLKKLLHLAAMAAIRSKGEIRDYYQHKVKEGKNKMLVLNNVRNKLIKRMFAVLKSNKPYTAVKTQPDLVL